MIFASGLEFSEVKNSHLIAQLDMFLRSLDLISGFYLERIRKNGIYETLALFRSEDDSKKTLRELK